MTITGQVGHIGVVRQADYIAIANVDATTITPTDYFVITSESLVPTGTPLVAENEIGRGRDRTGAVAAGFGISGGLGGYARVSDLGNLCQMALNDSAETADGSTGVCTVTPTDLLSYWSIEKNVGDTLYLGYLNGKVNSLTINASANAIATWTMDWVIAVEKKLEAAAATPDYTDDDLLAFHGGLIKIGGSQYSNMESIEIAINNNLSDDEYTVQPSRFLNGVTEGSRTIELSFNQVFANVDDYVKYTYGTPGLTKPGYALYETDVYFLLMNSQSKATATEWIEFYFPRVMFGGLPVTLTNGRIVVTNAGQVLAPAVGNIMTVMYKS